MTVDHATCSPEAFAPGRTKAGLTAFFCVFHLIAGVAVALIAIAAMALLS